MELIAHRINTVEELKKLDSSYGVELDLRDDLNGNIYISHNPFEIGEKFEDYLKNYHHGTMILNIKSERIELKIQEILKAYHITKYFFLDSSFPMIKFLSDEGEKRIAIRFSDYEGIDTLVRMKGRVKWIWVDCFEKFPLDQESYLRIKEMGYWLCFVSPELQGQPEKLTEYQDIMKREKICPDAVCAKSYNFDKWKID